MATAAEPAAALGPMTPWPYRVARRRRETQDTWTLELEPACGESVEPAPGQFAMLYAFGVGEAPVSFSGADRASGRVLHTVRAVGAVTRALCASRPGEVVGLRGPFGSRWPLAEARGSDVVVVAGGIGLAPLRPAVRLLLTDRPDYGSVSLLYGARTPRDLLYRREVERWRRRLDVKVTVDMGSDGWQGSVGVVTQLIPRAAFDPSAAVALVCGPEIMMRLAARALAEQGLAEDRIFVSLERNMRCAVAHCGHCQLGSILVCRDGPVLRYDRVARLWEVREL